MQYVIWSYKHQQWWGPNHCGYTPHLDQAGRYSPAEAGDIVTQSWVMEEIAVPELHAATNGPPRWHPYAPAAEEAECSDS